MLGTSLPELVYIRACIFALQYSIPLCVLIVALLRITLFRTTGTPPALVKTLTSLLALELLYAVLIYRPFTARLRATARHPPPLAPEQRAALFERCLASISDPERYLQLWFLGAGPAEIRRDNVRDFLLWAFFDRDSAAEKDDNAPGSLEGSEKSEMEAYLAGTEKMLGRPLPPGRGTAVPLRLTFDVVETRYRGVVWYAVVALVDLATNCRLFWHGFQLRVPSGPSGTSGTLGVFPPRPELLVPSSPVFFGRAVKGSSPSDKLGYWYRAHTSKAGLPVVFIHGIGIGLYPYATLLAEIPRETGVIALEILPVSMRLCCEPLSRDDFLREVGLIVSLHGWDRFVLVSHSYGSVLTTHILRSPALAPRVAGVVLIDPVSICLHLPDVAYNFTRRQPRQANEWMLWYFASMDPGTALVLGRHFFWKENIIWKEELLALPGEDETALQGNGCLAADGEIMGRAKTRRVAVVLSGRDLIVNTRGVARYLLHGGDRNTSPQQEDRLLEKLVGGNKNEYSNNKERGRSCLTQDGIEILWCPTLDHAEVFHAAEDRSWVLKVISSYCSSEPS